MTAFVALDVAIGLVFMYLLLAIVCTAINEWIASVFRLRARNLRTALMRLVDDPASPRPTFFAKLKGRVTGKRDGAADGERLSDKVWNHALIESIKDGTRGPSYIPAPRFVAAFRDASGLTAPEDEPLPSGGVGEPARVDPLSAPEPPPPGKVADDIASAQRQLQALRRTTAPRVRLAAPDVAVAAHAVRDDDDRIEEWFNQAMERASGWYRRKLLFITVAVSVLLTVTSNADTIAAAQILWRNPAVRAAVIAQAEDRIKKARPTNGGVLVQADYPDKDKPVSDLTPGAPEDNPEDENLSGEEEEPSASDAGITDAERLALGQIIGWERDFRRINAATCAARQQLINETCKPGVDASPACTKAVDNGPAGGVCVHGPNGLEPTDAFPRGRGLWGLFGIHVLGWFITAAAVSMGAPFWFDTLKLFMSVRANGKSPDESRK